MNMPTPTHASALRVWIVSSWLAAVSTVLGCNVPVFRYALERWTPGDYEAVVFHRGPLTSNLLSNLKSLEQEDKKPPANLTVRRVNLDEPLDEATADLWREQTNASLPWVALEFLLRGQSPVTFWTGSLTPDLATNLTISPARQQLAERLIKGHSAVWLFIESGHPTEDQAALKLLTSALKKQEQTLELPAAAPDDPPTRGASPVRIAFSVLRLERQHPLERFFLSQLLTGDRDLAKLAQPIVCPIFGRGRLLTALTGPQFTEEIIGEVCQFICGACSCQVKEMNPGRDLLMAADWDAVFEQGAGVVETPAPPPLTGLSQAGSNSVQQSVAVAAAPAAAPPPRASVPTRAFLAVLAALVALAALGTWMVKSKGSKS